MTRITDKTVKSKYPPKQTNVTWIDTSQKPAVTKSYIDGQWVVVGGGVTDYNDIKNKPTINGVELDGNKTSQDLEVYGNVPTKTLYLAQDEAELTTLGTGWSGDVINGFTHSSGNTDALVLNETTLNKPYLITINCNTSAENLYKVSIGDGSLIDPYNGNDQQTVGIISDGGNVKVTPSSTFVGVITIKVQECVDAESAVETVVVDTSNVDANNMDDAITAFWNVAIGPNQSTLSSAVSASRNIAIGINALLNLETGTRNIGIGTFSMSQLKDGTGNIAIGADAIFSKKGGNDNIAIGRGSIGSAANSATNNNICIGRSTGNNVSGDNNIAIGPAAGYNATADNIFIGENAGYNATGVKNIFIGRNSGYGGGSIAGNWNTMVGPSTGFANNVSKSTAIGYQAGAEKSNQNVIGSAATTETKIFGDLVVRGTDEIVRRVVFNSDNTVTWEAVE